MIQFSNTEHAQNLHSIKRAFSCYLKGFLFLLLNLQRKLKIQNVKILN